MGSDLWSEMGSRNCEEERTHPLLWCLPLRIRPKVAPLWWKAEGGNEPGGSVCFFFLAVVLIDGSYGWKEMSLVLLFGGYELVCNVVLGNNSLK